MADERIDVEVTDKVSSSVETKLRSIGDAAGDAHKYVENLKAALASMSTAGALKTEAAANSTTRALAQQMNAQAALTNATAKGALADAKAATEKQKLATELARTEAAQAKAGIAYAKSEAALNSAIAAEARAKTAAEQLNTATAKTAAEQAKLATEVARTAAAQAKAVVEAQRLATETARSEAAISRASTAASAAALAQLRLAAAQERAATSAASYAARAERLKSSLDPAYAAQARFNAEVAEAKTLLDNAAIGANTYEEAVKQANSRLNASATSMNALNRASGTYSGNMRGVADSTGLAGHQMGNLVAQLNDIGVSLAGGQNPLLVLIQQGSQIQYLASTVEGGFATIIRATTAMVIGQQQVTNATTAAAAATTAQASAAASAAAATALQTGIAANLVTAEQGVAVATAQATAATLAKTLADAELAVAQAAVGTTGTATAAAMNALALAEARALAAGQGATIASAELAAANSTLAGASLAAAQAQQRLALSSAGTALGLGAVGAVLVGLAPVVGTVAAQLIGFHKEINDEAGIKAYVATLGLTTKELKKLEDQTVTYGDMASGVWATIAEGVAGLSPVFDAIGAFIMGTIDLIWETLKRFSFSMTALFQGTYKAVITIWNGFPAAFADLFTQAANLAIASLEWVINKSVDALNYIGGSFEHTTLNRMENANAGAASRMGADIVAGYMDAYKGAESGYNAFVKRVGENSAKAARDRLKKGAAAIIEDRGAGPKAKKAKEDNTAENRASALANVNRELDNELSRMKMLKDERAIQQRYDQIEEQLARKKITLTKEESAAIREKITQIEANKYIQSEFDRIVESAQAPQRTYNASLAGAKQALDANVISQQQYQLELIKSARALAEATDPLLSFKDAIEQQERALGLYGDAATKNNYLETIRQKLVAEGYAGDELRNKLLSSEVQNLVAKNAALLQQQQINSTIGAIVDPMVEQANMLANETAYYSELQRLRDTDYLTEQQYYQARYALDAKFSEMRLQNASNTFGELAKLSSSGNKKLAAIGKAAAVVQATIDGYVAVQKALASGPPPWNFIQAAAVAVSTGAQVAGILSTNVGNFATGGQFMVEGQSGIDKNNINMNVSRGERVTIETAQQQRANDGSGGAMMTQGDVKIVNQFDEQEFVSAMDSDEGTRVILNVIKRNPNAVKAAAN